MMWTMLCALALWTISLAAVGGVGWWLGRRYGVEKKAVKAEAVEVDALEQEKRQRLQRELVNFMRYDGSPQQ